MYLCPGVGAQRAGSRPSSGQGASVSQPPGQGSYLPFDFIEKLDSGKSLRIYAQTPVARGEENRGAHSTPGLSPPTVLRLGAARPRLQGRPHFPPVGFGQACFSQPRGKRRSVTPAVRLSQGARGPGAHGSGHVWPRELSLGNLKCPPVSPRGPKSGAQRLPRPPGRGPCCSLLYTRILCEIRWKNKKDSAVFQTAWEPPGRRPSSVRSRGP